MLSEKNPTGVFDRLAELGLLAAITPDLAWTLEISGQVKACLDGLPAPEWDLPAQVGHIPLARALAYAAWFTQLPVDQALPAGQLLRFPAALMQAIAAAQHIRPELPGLVGARPGTIVERLEDTPRLALFVLYQTRPAAERELLNRFATQWRFIVPVTTGDDLRALGFAPGPGYRYLLAALRHAWLEGEITSADQEHARLRVLLEQQNFHFQDEENSI